MKKKLALLPATPCACSLAMPFAVSQELVMIYDSGDYTYAVNAEGPADITRFFISPAFPAPVMTFGRGDLPRFRVSGLIYPRT